MFGAVIESSVKEVRSGAGEDEEQGEAAAAAAPDSNSLLHQRFSRAAVLGRSCMPHSLLLLGNLLQERSTQLLSATSTGTALAFTPPLVFKRLANSGPLWTFMTVPCPLSVGDHKEREGATP